MERSRKKVVPLSISSIKPNFFRLAVSKHHFWQLQPGAQIRWIIGGEIGDKDFSLSQG